MERVYLELANQILAQGICVDLVLAQFSGDYISEIPRDVRVVNLETSGKLRIILGLARYLVTEKPNALLSGGNFSNLIAALASILVRRSRNCFISQRSGMNLNWELDRPDSYKFWIRLSRFVFNRTAAIICNSEYARNELIEELGIRSENCHVIYNAVDSEKIHLLSQEEPQDEWFAVNSDPDPVIIAIGSLSKVKDMETLIRAFAIAREDVDCNLLILGEGPERNKLQSLISELGIQETVRMPGFKANPFSYLSRSRLFISSSLTEGCPNAILQAMACNIPIIASDCPGGTAEILENGKWGQLFIVGDSKQLAQKIVEAISDPVYSETAQAMEKYTPESICKEYLMVLNPALGDSSDAVTI